MLTAENCGFIPPGVQIGNLPGSTHEPQATSGLEKKLFQVFEAEKIFVFGKYFTNSLLKSGRMPFCSLQKCPNSNLKMRQNAISG